MELGFRNNRYYNEPTFLTIKEFSIKSGLTEEEVLIYVHQGELFPLAPTRQRVLVRRIPSLLTEHLYNFVSDKERYEECFNKPNLYLGYNEHIDIWQEFLQKNESYAERMKKDLSKEYLPWMSDIQYTEGGYIYIGPEVVAEALTFGTANIQRFVSQKMTRGFYYPYSPQDIEDLYSVYKNSTEVKPVAPASLINRFSSEFNVKQHGNPTLCYPDLSISLEYLAELGKPLPISMWAAVECLGLQSIGIPCLVNIYSVDWITQLSDIEAKIKNLLADVDGNEGNKQTFFKLVWASSYFDQWIALFPERKELTCTYDSLRLSSVQVDYAKALKSKTGGAIKYDDTSRRRFINYNYCVQRSFIYHLMSSVKKYKSEDKNHGVWLDRVIDNCIGSAQDDLATNKLFAMLAESCSGAAPGTNFYKLLKNIDKDACSGLILDESNPPKIKKPKKKSKVDAEKTVSDDNDGA
jgi:hypothetical protein